MQPSSADLHPTTGARFVFERLVDTPSDPVEAPAEPAEGPRYALAIYLPEGLSWSGALRWDEGRSVIEGEPEQADERVRSALDQAHKLARVLRRDPKPKLIRWRG